MSSGGSRISPRWGRQLSKGGPTYDFAKFSQKLHEIERIWTPSWGASLAAPIRSATDEGSPLRIDQLFKKIQMAWYISKSYLSLWGWLCTCFCNRFSQLISMRSSLSFCSSKTVNISSSASFSTFSLRSSPNVFAVPVWTWPCLVVVSLWPWPCVSLLSFWFWPIVCHEFPTGCSSDIISTE